MGEQKRPIEAVMDSDRARWDCPCGSGFSVTGVYHELLAWITEHRDHSDGTFKMSCTERGAAFLSVTPPTARFTLPDRRRA